MKFDKIVALILLVPPLLVPACATQKIDYEGGELAHWQPGPVAVNYLEAARRAGAEGFVLVGYTIMPDGSVGDPFPIRAAIHGKPTGAAFRIPLTREVLDAIARRTYTSTSPGFAYKEIETMSLVRFVMPPITEAKEACQTPNPADEFDPSKIKIAFGVLGFDPWGYTRLERAETQVPLVPLRTDSSTLYGVQIDNPECQTFFLSSRIDPAKNPWFTNSGQYFERRDNATGSLFYESGFSKITSHATASILALRSDDIPGEREIEVRINNEPFTIIRYTVTSPPR